ncbi:tRNA-splicing endonuclease subunit [Geranomyces variabilis]|uniref:tRNA-splicing endonuclease subunit Sen34 n=1 Tax=Geranomyces variabilis TaxID=109894 RepID=A0AAD5TFI6_9FUNG|nr:tRNA-splicing endonuclease subunit [Geranomyces variabilis]
MGLPSLPPPSCLPLPNLPIVYLSRGRGYVWDADIVLILRTRYHILGALIGTLPRLPLQNTFFSLPLQLLDEELTLLLQRELISVVDSPNAHRKPNEEELADFAKIRASAADAYEEARRRTVAENQAEKRNMMTAGNKAAQGVMGAKAEPAGLDNFCDNALQNDNDGGGAVKGERKGESGTEELTKHEQQSLRPPPSAPVSIPASSRGFAWFDNGPQLQYQQAIDAGIWHPPATEIEILRYRVFCALWEKGYFIGPGSKFGGDFVLYPGDMLRYHSQFVVSVVPVDKMYSPLDAVMFGRLGTAVKKSHAMCSWDNEKDEMLCYCIQWTSWN